MRNIIIAIVLALLVGQEASAARRATASHANWWLCPARHTLPHRPEFSNDNRAPGSTEVRANSTKIIEHEISQFSGDAELIKDNEAVRGDEITYDERNELIDVQGHAHLWGPSLLWIGDRGLLNLDDNVSRLERGNYWLLDSPARGQAELIRHNDRQSISRLFKVDYTTCPEGEEVWKFTASKIKLDHLAERGSATNAILKVYNVPIFYIPYINFPLSDARKSGFLPPTIGTSSRSGLDIRQPYYINIAPNHDATVTPRVLDSRGVMLGGEYRYKYADIDGSLNFDYLPSDKLANGSDRSSVSFKHQQYYAEHRGVFNALLQNVSDAHYFEDFGYNLAVTSQIYLDRRIETTYANNLIWVHGLMQSYQIVDDSLPAKFGPYRRLPQIFAQTMFPMQNLRPYFFASTEMTYFDRDSSVTGGRMEVIPTLSFPIIKSYAFIKPTIALRHRDYLLTNPQNFDSHEQSDIPQFSLDSQLFFERRFNALGKGFLQTLEPRAYYLLVPKVGQDNLPVFDTGLYDFSFVTLFLDNRFSGRDRIGDANQMAVGVTSRLYSLDSGKEVIRGSLGQIYYFRNRAITLPTLAEDGNSTSEFIGEVAANMTDSWSARATLQWDPNDNETRKSALSIRYRPDDETVVNASYRLRKTTTDVEQTDLSFRVPITERIGLVGRWNYSLQSKQTLEVVGGIEYESCCWGLRIVSRRFIRNIQGEFDTSILAQFEFKGLGGFGQGASSLLQKSVPGYEATF